jgi:hypothetical protein
MTCCSRLAACRVFRMREQSGYSGIRAAQRGLLRRHCPLLDYESNVQWYAAPQWRAHARSDDNAGEKWQDAGGGLQSALRAASRPGVHCSSNAGDAWLCSQEIRQPLSESSQTAAQVAQCGAPRNHGRLVRERAGALSRHLATRNVPLCRRKEFENSHSSTPTASGQQTAWRLHRAFQIPMLLFSLCCPIITAL